MKFSQKSFKNKNLKRKISVNVRILFDYMQMVSITQNVQFSWPFYIEQYFRFFSFISLSNKIFSMDCLINDYNINLSVVYFEGIILVIMPFLISLLSGIYYFIYNKKNRKYARTKVIAVIFIVFTYLQTSIISQLLEILACKEIDGVSYLINDMDFICYTSDHIEWVLIYKNKLNLKYF